MADDFTGIEARLDVIGAALTPPIVLVANLPDPPTFGQTRAVTDGDSSLSPGTEVVNSGAGATPYLVWYNGTQWNVIGT